MSIFQSNLGHWFHIPIQGYIMGLPCRLLSLPHIYAFLGLGTRIPIFYIFKARAIGQRRAPRRAIKSAIKTGLDEEQLSEKELPGYDELRRMYILKLIQQVKMAEAGGRDVSAIKAEADMRKEELDRIERLLGMWSETTKRGLEDAESKPLSRACGLNGSFQAGHANLYPSWCAMNYKGGLL